jgi:hypothetical protein
MKQCWVLLVSCAIVMAAMTVAGCSFRERMCSSGKHAVWSVQYPETGRTCVRDGDAPPAGYATYPPGKTPTYVDEDLACSGHGKCAGGSLAIKCPPSFPTKPCRIQGVALPLP